ncbi:MAG: hypothetical protein IPM74_11815 [Crocinitomicaceae bacterium]|nr:hypothetical protein [Crocinitomicaceae bacterium]
MVLFDSISSQTKSTFHFYVFLIDEMPEKVKLEKPNLTILKVSEVSQIISEFKDLKSKYTNFELSCALKPFCANYLLQKSIENSLIVYLDSDILFYHCINLIEQEIGLCNIMLSPHFLSPPPDFNKIGELETNNAGLYNGGFFAIKNCQESIRFIDWWKERLYLYCFTDFANGMFVDQIWLNYVPLYFDNVHIIKNPGMNVGVWNFHENKIALNENGEWKVNFEFPLVFFHFGGYRLERKDLVCIHQTRYTFKNTPEVHRLFNNYAAALEASQIKYNFIYPKNLW